MGALNKNLESLAEKLDSLFVDEEHRVDEYLDDPEHYEDYFCDATDNVEIQDKVRELIEDWVEENTDYTIDSALIDDKLINEAILAAEVELGRGYHSGGDNELHVMGLYGSEYDYEIEICDALIDQLNELNQTQLDELKNLCSDWGATHYLDQCAKDGVKRYFLAYTTYNCTPTLALSDDQVEEFATRALTESKRTKSAQEIAKQWRLKNPRFACIDGGQAYSLKELLPYREARRKRLGLKHQNTKGGRR